MDWSKSSLIVKIALALVLVLSVPPIAIFLSIAYVKAVDSHSLPALPVIDGIRKYTHRAWSCALDDLDYCGMVDERKIYQRVCVSQDIKAGTVVNSDMLEVEKRPVPCSSCFESIDEVVGHRLKSDILVGNSIHRNQLEP